MAALGAPVAGGHPALGLAALLPPATPHTFTRCTPLGVDAEQDYLRVPITCGVYGAFPTLGWIDVAGVYPGHAGLCDITVGEM